MSELFVDCWGSGVPVVLVHGSLAIGAEEWQAQRPLADAGFRLVVPDRRGHGRSPATQGEDFLRDADDTPTSWVMLPTLWVILMVGSAFSLPLPNVLMQPYR